MEKSGVHKVDIHHKSGRQRKKIQTHLPLFVKVYRYRVAKTAIITIIVLLLIFFLYLILKPSAEEVAQNQAMTAFNKEILKHTGFGSLKELKQNKGYKAAIGDTVMKNKDWEVKINYQLLVYDGFNNKNITVKYTGLVNLKKDAEPQVIVKV